MSSFARIGPASITELRLTVGQQGPWCVDARMDDDLEIGSRVVLEVGALQLSGTVAPQSGTFGQRRSARIVGGGNGWGKILAPRAYANDAGVKPLLVAQDAAREAGEELGGFAVDGRLGPHFIRQAGSASRCLEQVIGDASWWVDYDGITQVGVRPTIQPGAGSYEVLHHDPRTQVVTLAVDDPSAIVIGSVLSERLDDSQTVREFQLDVDGSKMRMRAWCGGSVTTRGNLAGLMERIVTHVMNKRLLGKRCYRVVELAGDRVNLQIVKKATGMPDLLNVPHWPGTPGVEFELTEGAEVLVEFLDGGDPTLPAITGYAGKDGVGFEPQSMTFFGESLNIFGGIQGIARKDDPIEVVVPPGKFSGTIMVGSTPTTVSDLDVCWPMTLKGKLTGGSSKMKCG